MLRETQTRLMNDTLGAGATGRERQELALHRAAVAARTAREVDAAHGEQPRGDGADGGGGGSERRDGVSAPPPHP